MGRYQLSRSWSTDQAASKSWVSGDTDFYAVGSGDSIGGQHVQGMAIDSTKYPSCAGSYIFNDVPAHTQGCSTAKIVFDHGNGLGLQGIDGISFVVNGQQEDPNAL
ncbi:hypothetical protein B0H14DRAFT_3441309 [Mycena olivaceomarginata]|nr:hypothetical protein B0H14DRAFT_3441309 [Mycena olivaceomarginata]